MKTKRTWIVSFIFNDFTHVKRFTEYEKALQFYHIQEENGYNPSIHEG
jgi:hypothetical protein